VTRDSKSTRRVPEPAKRRAASFDVRDLGRRNVDLARLVNTSQMRNPGPGPDTTARFSMPPTPPGDRATAGRAFGTKSFSRRLEASGRQFRGRKPTRRLRAGNDQHRRECTRERTLMHGGPDGGTAMKEGL
jgi:hypothetical protein